MPKLQRDRDCLTLVKGTTFPVSFDPEMLRRGWVGGQGVRFTGRNPGFQGPTVTYADGVGSGFMLTGSDEPGADFTTSTRAQTAYRFGTGGFGGWVISTVAFEQYTYLSRQGGPLVPIAYNPSDLLYFSLRGYWTVEDEWTVSGDPRAPNTNVYGTVIQAPTISNPSHLTLQVFL